MNSAKEIMNNLRLLSPNKVDETYKMITNLKCLSPAKINTMIEYLKPVIQSHSHGDHGLSHLLTVCNHAYQGGLEMELNSPMLVLCIVAALLHEVSDTKFFSGQCEKYERERVFLDHFGFDGYESELVIFMIDNCSCSKNGNIIPNLDKLKNNKYMDYIRSELSEINIIRWILLVRWADRIESCGRVGLYRTHAYSIAVKEEGNDRDKDGFGERRRPFCANTFIPRQEDLFEWCKKKFDDYVGSKGINTSTMDSIFSRYMIHVPHMGKQEKNANTGINYFDQIFDKKRNIWDQFIARFYLEEDLAENFLDELLYEYKHKHILGSQ